MSYNLMQSHTVCLCSWWGQETRPIPLPSLSLSALPPSPSPCSPPSPKHSSEHSSEQLSLGSTLSGTDNSPPPHLLPTPIPKTSFSKSIYFTQQKSITHTHTLTHTHTHSLTDTHRDREREREMSCPVQVPHVPTQYGRTEVKPCSVKVLSKSALVARVREAQF